MAHAMRTVATLRLMCDPRDLGALAEVRSASTRRPTVTIYEVYPGGVGYAQRLYELHEPLLADAAQLVRECPCTAGCPSCVGPQALAREGNDEDAKSACLRLLSASA
jgi:DEAD/DEAH box helicase domain-containing protein